MSTSTLPFLSNSDPRLRLTVKNRIRNVFVTQPEDIRDKNEENVNYIPIVTEPPGRVLEAGVYTLQKTLVLKKRAELDEVDKQLALKRREFKNYMEGAAKRRTELEIKLNQTRERAMKFKKFVAETEAKRLRALKKFESAREQNISKQREIEDLTEQLNHFKARQQVLKERMAKYKIYEDYLMKTQDYLPSTHIDNGNDSAVMPIIQRHETLSSTHQQLLQRLNRLEAAVEQGQGQLQVTLGEHSRKKLMAIKELSELQNELEILKEDNKQVELKLQMEQGLCREKVKDVGNLLTAINNLADQCYLAAYGSLEDMDTLTMLDMVKEYILDKADTEKRARRLMESGSAVTSRTALADRRGRGSMKSMSSKTQLKSSSKISRKSGTTTTS